MDYKYLILAIVIIVFTWIGYKIGRLLEAFYGDETDDETINTLKDLYCFECEIEMPVKEKNGRLYCKNCGLYH